MTRGSYQVRSITWSESANDKQSFDAFDDEDAAELWCKAAEGNGCFSDGYPVDHELEITAPDGTVTMVEVDTDWEPNYYFRSHGAQ